MNLTTFELLPIDATKLYVLKDVCIDYAQKMQIINNLEWYAGICLFLLLWRIFIEHEEYSWKNIVPIGVLILWMITAMIKTYH